MIALGIILIALAVAALIVCSIFCDRMSDLLTIVAGVTIACFIVFGVVLICEVPNKPSAIDVYRGNTELVIHYEMRDSVLTPTDSVVVFKEK